MYVVKDPEHRFLSEDWAHRLNRPDEGRLAYWTTPDGRNVDWIARDLLKALGKDSTMRGRVRGGNRRFDQACAWLVGHNIADLLVGGIERLEDARLDAIVQAALISDARLWLLVSGQSLPDAASDYVARWPHETVDLDTALVALDTKDEGFDPEPAAEVVAADSIPPDEFPTFLHAVRETLDDRVAAAVEHRFQHACNATARWFSSLGPRRPSETDVAEFLGSLLADDAETLLAVAALRAAQATLLLVGIVVKLELRRFLYAAEDTPVGLDPTTARRLEAYAHPQYAAIACMQRATRLPAKAIQRVTVADLLPAAAALATPGREVRLSHLAQPSLRAQLAKRLMEGAGPDDPLFVMTNGEPITSHAQQQLADLVSHETGVRIYAHWTDFSDKPGKGWRQRRGITVRDLSTTNGRPST
jgi:hypothetical protein